MAGQLRGILRIHGSNKHLAEVFLCLVRPGNVGLSARLKIGHIQGHHPQAGIIAVHGFHTLGLSPGLRIGNVVGIVASHHKGTNVEAVTALAYGRGTDEIPVIADFVKLRRPDKLAIALYFTLIPYDILLGVSQAFNGIRHTDYQSVIAVCSVLTVYRIGSSEVISVSLLIIGNAGICPLLNQGLFRLCKVRGSSNRSSDGVLHAFSGRIGLFQIITVPADGVGLLFAIRIGSFHLAEGLIQSFFDILSLIYCDLIHFVVFQRCVVGIGEFVCNLVILCLGQGNL